jgi:hypothetical protein
MDRSNLNKLAVGRWGVACAPFLERLDGEALWLMLEEAGLVKPVWCGLVKPEEFRQSALQSLKAALQEKSAIFSVEKGLPLV